jgi:hypothetical protein
MTILVLVNMDYLISLPFNLAVIYVNDRILGRHALILGSQNLQVQKHY